MPNWTELLSIARESADAAAAVHEQWLGDAANGAGGFGLGAPSGRNAGIRAKGRGDFVSKVDLDAQEAAIEVLERRSPGVAVLAEEAEDAGGEATSPADPHATDDAGAASRHGSRDADAADPAPSLLWVVDPLDGTTNFLHGHPAFCSSVGLLADGRPQVGAVSAVATGERWWAAPGEGAWRNGARVRVSGTRELAGALVGTGFPFKRLDELPRYLAQFERVLPACHGIRRGGSAALDLCYLAQGSLDAFWEGRLAPWDIAGGLAILKEAGGCWSRLDGRPLAVARGGSVLAANGPELRTELRDLL